jgi:hypothetical protein
LESSVVSKPAASSCADVLGTVTVWVKVGIELCMYSK